MHQPIQFPTAVVFDLDYTLWPLWCDTHIAMPLKPVSRSKVIDSEGMEISFYKDVEHILLDLKEKSIPIVGASRTATPKIAQKLLSLLQIGDKPAITYFDSLQWGQGSKVNHIKRAAKDLGLSKDMEKGGFILFDDEWRNRDVESIGCYFAYVSDERKGLTHTIYTKELDKWRKSHNKDYLHIGNS
ncbi:uncharacterized protein PRCAT00002958001 [Priceomyces carsonii]|uniref:uncharacterized protein n=1 Tax=Priceomyces carsonii TaxID=28549 RepID=UPI002ED899CE|nr:unnamed protein product [Priceomyces carsonii]